MNDKASGSRLEKIAIVFGLFVSVLALVIIVYALMINHARAVSQETTTATQTEILPEETVPETMQTEIIPDSNHQTRKKFSPIALEVEICTGGNWDDNCDKPPLLPIEEIYGVQENLSKWFLANETTDLVTFWKKSDDQGNLMIALKDENGEVLAIFKYEEQIADYPEWTPCQHDLEEVSTRDIIDISFVDYHEVGGKNVEGIWSQTATLCNRVNNEMWFADTVRGVVTEPAQYSCKNCVIKRRMKSSSEKEKQDLESCFRAVLLYLADEATLDVPDNVVFAARGKQGSGVWREIDGTYYCYI